MLTHALLAAAVLLQPPAATPQPPRPAAAPTFPDTWIGHWKGDATVGTDERSQKFTMELKVAATSKPDRYSWTIIYDGATGRQERPYTLIVKDAAKGLYTIDENNGILIDARTIGGTLYSHFAVQGNRITTRQRLESPGTPAEHISVEMITTRDDSAAISGGKDATTKVESWTPLSLQQAKLNRVPAPSPDKNATPVLPAASQTPVSQPHPIGNM